MAWRLLRVAHDDARPEDLSNEELIAVSAMAGQSIRQAVDPASGGHSPSETGLKKLQPMVIQAINDR